MFSFASLAPAVLKGGSGALGGALGGSTQKVKVNQNSSNVSSAIISSSISNVLGGDADTSTGEMSTEVRGEAVMRNKPASSSGFTSSFRLSGGTLGQKVADKNSMFWIIGGTVVLGAIGLVSWFSTRGR